MRSLRHGSPLRDEVLRREKEVAALVAWVLLTGLLIPGLACGGGPGPQQPTEVVIAPDGSAPPAQARRIDAPPQTSSGDSSAPLVWAESPEAARALATHAKKPMLVFVRAEWSTAALEMEREVLDDPVVERAARPYVLARLDATEEKEQTYYWLNALGVKSVPAVALVDSSGRREVIDGLVTAEELSRKLNEFVERE